MEDIINENITKTEETADYDRIAHRQFLQYQKHKNQKIAGRQITYGTDEKEDVLGKVRRAEGYIKMTRRINESIERNIRYFNPALFAHA